MNDHDLLYVLTGIVLWILLRPLVLTMIRGI